MEKRGRSMLAEWVNDVHGASSTQHTTYIKNPHAYAYQPAVAHVLIPSRSWPCRGPWTCNKNSWNKEELKGLLGRKEIRRRAHSYVLYTSVQMRLSSSSFFISCSSLHRKYPGTAPSSPLSRLGGWAYKTYSVISIAGQQHRFSHSVRSRPSSRDVM